MIRPATPSDVPMIVEMAQTFVAHTPYQGHFTISPEHLTEFATNVIGNPESVVLLSERSGRPVGMLAMTVFLQPMTGDRVASEIVWWMDPQARGEGVRLLRAAEAWARAQQATVVHMIAPDERVGAFYEALGYAKVESSFARRL